MSYTIKDIVDALSVSLSQGASTVDGLLFGDAGRKVTGIVTAFMPTLDVIRQTIEHGSNLIVAHEDPFYSHHDGIGLHGDRLVSQEKKRRLEASGIAIYRCHDYPHRLKPDLITDGLIRAVGWEGYVQDHQPEMAIVEIPSATLSEIAHHLKGCLGIPSLRVLGNLDMRCSRIGLLAGYRGGGRTVIPLFESERLDLVVYGEGPEWETPEYVRDALYSGDEKALLVLGHAESEEPGMAGLADLLRRVFPRIPVRHLKEKPLFHIL